MEHGNGIFWFLWIVFLNLASMHVIFNEVLKCLETSINGSSEGSELSRGFVGL